MRIAQPWRPSDAKAMRSLIRRDTRGKGDGAEVGDGMLALPVVIHLPYFFVPASRGDVVDMRLGDAGNAATEAGDDLVGEAVSDQARIVLAGCFVVLLAQDLRRFGILGVEETAVNRQTAARRGKRSEGHHGSIRRSRCPLRQIHLLRRGGHKRRSHALGNHVKDAGVIQIVIEGAVEGRFQRRSLCIAGSRSKVSRGQPNACRTQISSSANPVLCACSPAERQKQEDKKPNSEWGEEISLRALMPYAVLSLNDKNPT